MKNVTLKDRILYGSIIVLILLLIFNNCQNGRMQKKLSDQLRETNKEIVKNSKLIKEKDGQYSKLVNNFNTQKELLKSLKEENKELYKTLKDNNEKILMINKSVISLREKVIEGFGKFDPKDSNLINLSLKYPEDKDWFISWDGSIHTKTAHYQGNWSFGQLPLKIILTETERGLWNNRIIGPEWLIVDEMEINALKPEEISQPYVPQPRNLGFILGGGYIHSFDSSIPKSLSVGVGLYFKNESLILNGTTNKSIGLSYYHRFVTFKKNN